MLARRTTIITKSPLKLNFESDKDDWEKMVERSAKVIERLVNVFERLAKGTKEFDQGQERVSRDY